MNTITRIKNKINQEYKERVLYPSKVKGKQKIFCIGRNKTGTTSLESAFIDLGFILGNQSKAERLLPFYKKGNFEPIVDYCKTAQVFQDFPFSYPKTYKYLDSAFPHSKFILTVRDSPEQWYNSVTKYHTRMFGKGNIPTKENLQNASYVWKGWIWECNRIMYNTPENDPYNKGILIQTYNEHNQSVMDYFKNRPNDLIIINVAEKGSYHRLMNFLNIESPFDNFPWKNKTEKMP